MKIIMPVYEHVEMLDLCGPYEMFRWAGLEVQLVAEKPGMVEFNKGFSFHVPDGLLPRHSRTTRSGSRAATQRVSPGSSAIAGPTLTS
jgi:putative intracellular protease/amidase